MADKHLIPLLVAMMLTTGVANTIITKFQDMQCIRNCDDPDPARRVTFEFPVLQTLQMFVGEMGCWIVVFITSLVSAYTSRHRTAPLLANDAGEDDDRYSVSEGRVAGTGSDSSSTLLAKTQEEENDNREPLRGLKILLLALPACFDITGTTLMNVGLLFVVASIYQMTRGALVLFVGLFSIIFLHRKLYAYQWLALFTVVLGVGLVGLAGALAKPVSPQSLGDAQSFVHEAARAIVKRAEDTYSAASTPEALRIVFGVMFIAGAQIFTASQFVLEEWILERYAMTPLKVVGWEGVFGFTATFIGMLILHALVGSTEAGRGGYFDAVEGWRAVVEHSKVMWSSFAIMMSIGGFNFFGISVTQSVSATSRSTIDTCRTLFIWMISLALGWETFKWLQVVGFAMLVYGTFLFNDIVRPPLKKWLVPRNHVHEELLPEEPIEHI
ncbi:hypothetical protein KEM56_004313 [Ascosphaera pollenicola]|nr:hypothetical protein KEM56_004313 [Ascosphaera pollenicola]